MRLKGKTGRLNLPLALARHLPAGALFGWPVPGAHPRPISCPGGPDARPASDGLPCRVYPYGFALLDDLVRRGQQRFRDGEAEGLYEALRVKEIFRLKEIFFAFFLSELVGREHTRHVSAFMA